MIAGYVRLSRDDDRKNYISIENQKMLINRYAASQRMVIDRWYEDDGISGYSFNRPGFGQLLNDLDIDVDTIIAKDLSRIGRHNAKVLLLLDDLKERGKRLLLVDDNYDTMEDEDDIIGIKTWYNERYVKDTSKKIRKVIKARQQEGTYMCNVPIGYIRNKDNKTKIKIVEEEACYIRRIFELYLQGYGYRKIAIMLTEQGIPTPSYLLHERGRREGKNIKRRVTRIWSDGMIADILKNDFYIGNLRLNKRARTTINGAGHRVPREDQILFENNHAAIVQKQTFELVQEIMKKRVKTNYRGQSQEGSAFGSCLFCKDCKSRLTPIRRATGNTSRKYYICTTYNTKGKRYCEHSHLIYEEDLREDVITYIKLCKDALSEVIKTYDLSDMEKERKSMETRRQSLLESIEYHKSQLKAVLSQKVNDITYGADASLINETYTMLQEDILARIHGFELQLGELDDSKIDQTHIQDKLNGALDVVNHIIEKETIDRKDVERLIEKITIDENGLPDIELKYGISKLVKYNPAEELNRHENEIILTVLRLIQEEERTYTSAKYLLAQLTRQGYPKSKNSVLPYLSIMMDKGVLEQTDNKLKPYRIQKPKDEIADMIKCIIDTMSGRRDARDGF